MNEKNTAATSSNPEPRIRLDRRALLRAGAGASPVLLTLVSNPVAATNSCVVASSFVSVATFKSRNPAGASISCGARTVSQWKDYCANNASCGAAKVKDTLGDHWQYGQKTLRQMLMDYASTSGTEGLLRHLAAMYLSLTVNGGIRSGWSAGQLSVVELRNIWSQCKMGGNYRLPSSGINWSTTQVIQWLTYQLNYPAPL